MKFLLTALFFPLLSIAQRDEHVRAFEKSIPVNAGKEISLPKATEHLDGIANYEVVLRVRVIDSYEEYRKAFPRFRYTKDSLEKYKNDSWAYEWIKKFMVDSLPAIDFRSNELVIYSGCGQCLAYCADEDSHRTCHRNSCYYQYKGYVRKKKYDLANMSGDKKIFLDALYGRDPAGMRPNSGLSGRYKHDAYRSLVGPGRSAHLLKVDSTLYQQLFSWELKNYPAELPHIDFTKKELWLRLVCHRCLIYCDATEPGWNNTSCHKGECVFDQSWFIKNV